MNRREEHLISHIKRTLSVGELLVLHNEIGTLIKQRLADYEDTPDYKDEPLGSIGIDDGVEVDLDGLACRASEYKTKLTTALETVAKMLKESDSNHTESKTATKESINYHCKS